MKPESLTKKPLADKIDSRSTKTKHSFDEELGDDFLSSWKPSKLMDGPGLELDDDPPPKSNKKAFSLAKLDMDFDFDGGLNALSSFDVDMSALDFSSSPPKVWKKKLAMVDSPEKRQKEKSKTQNDGVKFRFNFKGFDDLELDDTLLKKSEAFKEPIEPKQTRKQDASPTSGQSLCQEEHQLHNNFADELSESDMSGDTLGTSIKSASCKAFNDEQSELIDKESVSPVWNELKHGEASAQFLVGNDIKKLDALATTKNTQTENSENTALETIIDHPARKGKPLEKLQDDIMQRGIGVNANKETMFAAGTAETREGIKTVHSTFSEQTQTINHPFTQEQKVLASRDQYEGNDLKVEQPLLDGTVPMELQEEQDEVEKVNNTLIETVHAVRASDKHKNSERKSSFSNFIKDMKMNENKMQTKGHLGEAFKEVPIDPVHMQFNSKSHHCLSHDIEPVSKSLIQQQFPKDGNESSNNADFQSKTRSTSSHQRTAKDTHIKIRTPEGNAEEGQGDKQNDSFELPMERENVDEGKNCPSPRKIISNNSLALAKDDLSAEPKLLESADVNSRKSQSTRSEALHESINALSGPNIGSDGKINGGHLQKLPQSAKRSIDSPLTWIAHQKKELKASTERSSSKLMGEKPLLPLIPKQSDKERQSSLLMPDLKAGQIESLKFLKGGSRGLTLNPLRTESSSGLHRNPTSERCQMNKTFQKPILQASGPLIAKHEPQLPLSQSKVEKIQPKPKASTAPASNAVGAKGHLFGGLKSFSLTSTAACRKNAFQVADKTHKGVLMKKNSGLSLLSQRKSAELIRSSSDCAYQFEIECKRKNMQQNRSSVLSGSQPDIPQGGTVDVILKPTSDEKVFHKGDGSSDEEMCDAEINRELKYDGCQITEMKFSENQSRVSKDVLMLDSNGIAEKSESYSRDLEDMYKSLKKKHEEAMDLHVRALVLTNSLLMLRNPMNEEKIRGITKSIEDIFTGSYEIQDVMAE